MATTTVTQENAGEIASRFLNLYTGAIADILDKSGYRNQVLPYNITPFTAVNRVAGPAFTGQGYPCADTSHDDSKVRLKILDSLTPGAISIWATGGSMDCAHWGEIMATVAMRRGCTGAVVDGGVRDLDCVNAMKFPVFAKFKSAASCVGRWDAVECQVKIEIGETAINPGDFVFGDVDGVVIVPKDITLDVLAAAEKTHQRERGMRAELSQGISIGDAFTKYGSF